MNWQQRKVLVTGAGGFIGSHLAETLTAAGADVTALVRYNSSGDTGWLEGSPQARAMRIISGDITDADRVSDAMRGCEIVFHLAALIAIPYSYHAPRSYVRTNIEGTLNVLQAARASGAQRVVHTSTSEVYGTARQVPISEEHPLQGQSPYSASKIGADKLAEAFHLSFALPVVTVRPFNTYGPRQSARAVIPAIIGQCLKGNVIRLGNLHPTRDLNYVEDTVQGFLRAAGAEAAIGKTINLGSGREISIGDLAALIGKIMGKDVQIETEGQRLRPENSEVERLLADNTRAGQLLGWTPKVTLEVGLTRTISWFRDNLHRYQPEQYTL